jgi:hypothetical protein
MYALAALHRVGLAGLVPITAGKQLGSALQAGLVVAHL